jgi:L-erythro-3,5-diaminohexanoate dehydrogenase
MPCARVPADLPPAVALAALDVYPAASHTRALARLGNHVLVLGAGHAGLLALAAARQAVGPDGILTAVDRNPKALEKSQAVDSQSNAIEADVTDPLAVARGVVGVKAPRADLTLLCTSVAGAEGAAILATAPRGTIVFFSTATKFAAAALGADAIGSQPRLVIPSGLTDDRGEYALELLRTLGPLQAAFERA